jgi:phosphoribosylanthranilate isomerase
MTRIKICGIKREEEVRFLNGMLPDYAGFVFAAGRRRLVPDEALLLTRVLDRRIAKVGVFQDQPAEEVRRCAELLELDVVQLHGSEGEEHVDALKGFRVWKAAGIEPGRAGPFPELRAACGLGAEAVLLDSSCGGKSGGTGVCFDWSIARDLAAGRKIILAGGLSPDNVEEAIAAVRPWAVDVSSGVEENGMKSLEKIKNFIEKVRKRI